MISYSLRILPSATSLLRHSRNGPGVLHRAGLVPECAVGGERVVLDSYNVVHIWALMAVARRHSDNEASVIMEWTVGVRVLNSLSRFYPVVVNAKAHRNKRPHQLPNILSDKLTSIGRCCSDHT